MRYLLLFAVLLSSAASAEPTTTVSDADLHQARGLGETYRRCQLDQLGERSLGPAVADTMQLARDIATSCRPQLDIVQRFLAARGYAQATVQSVLVDIKARADGATIAAIHRLPPYRL